MIYNYSPNTFMGTYDILLPGGDQLDRIQASGTTGAAFDEYLRPD
jgi:hypothetical protein